MASFEEEAVPIWEIERVAATGNVIAGARGSKFDWAYIAAFNYERWHSILAPLRVPPGGPPMRFRDGTPCDDSTHEEEEEEGRYGYSRLSVWSPFKAPW
jgi:hypothetical protein